MFNRIIATGTSMLLVLITANTTLACACCVNRGHYERGRIKTNQFYTSIFGEIGLNGPAELYMTEAGFDGIKGLPDLAKDGLEGRETTFEIRSDFSKRKWTISVDAGSGRKGTLVLPLPAMFTKHAVDIDGVDNGNGVTLYKEFSLSNRLTTATGIFKSSKSANYEVVFQGRGNGCDDRSDFNRWFLIVDGPRASYVIFGRTT